MVIMFSHLYPVMYRCDWLVVEWNECVWSM